MKQTPVGIGVIRVRGLPGQPHRGLLRAGNRAFPVALGRGGIGFDKREGDGRTPAGTWRILRVLYRGDRAPRPASRLVAKPIGAADGWCDDPQDRRYNQPVRLPLKASHEEMRREDGLYDLVLVLDHNTRPRVKGRGSAVFIHIARAGLKPTEGCVALPPQELKRLAARLRPGARIVISP